MPLHRVHCSRPLPRQLAQLESVTIKLEFNDQGYILNFSIKHQKLKRNGNIKLNYFSEIIGKVEENSHKKMPHRVKDFPSLTWWRESIGSSIHKVLSRSYSNSAEAFPFAYRFSQFIWRAFIIHQRTFILSPSKAAKLPNYSTMDHCSRQ